MLDSRERSPGGRSGLGAHTQPVPPLSPSRGRAEGGARGETCSQNTHAGMWGRQGLGEAKPPVETTGQRETPIRLRPTPPGTRQRPLDGEHLEVPKRGLYAGLAPISDKSPHLTTRVVFFPLHLLLDRSWWCHDSAPQGAGSAGSYIPRSGGGLRMPSQMEAGVTSLWRCL